ncbi:MULTISPECIES: DUF5680 domain-containing protein [unclassified Rhizobium]|uniref:DUF5680 domain-containing protein n=1 Tax=unclassified Rhizobium TaxID=2613769 RepID=UPI000EA87985|nr:MULTISPECIES: DUF5680 domain-containing protein [unclassified Rhizobium]AYG65854.1 hypothetical protein CCGE531_07480 [Rhizobium sp. CCGE531]AYG72335.1 hypothetical protein CCGE532_07480 [Rhizobium sp. CCGE532]
MPDLAELNGFIVIAKAETYVGDGERLPSCRSGSHDIGYANGRWRYLDSYFGGTDFAGQELVWHDDEPVWAMNYFGHIIEPDLIDGTRAGMVIKSALLRLYLDEKRFLGGFEFEHAYGRYIDRSTGDCHHFIGHEAIMVGERKAYELDYRGGLIVS